MRRVNKRCTSVSSATHPRSRRRSSPISNSRQTAIVHLFCPCRSGLHYSLSLAPAFRTPCALEGNEHKANGSFASIEAVPGQIFKIPIWMLDSAACAGMKMGPPRVSLAALAALHDLLVAQGLRRWLGAGSSSGSSAGWDGAGVSRRTSSTPSPSPWLQLAIIRILLRRLGRTETSPNTVIC